MKREELKALGLEDTTIDKVMALHGKTVGTLTSDLNSAKSERDSYKEQLDTNQTELNNLRDSAKGNEDLSKQLADLQAKYDSSKTESDAKLAKTEKEFAIKLALKDANALDDDIALSQLDLETIKLNDGGLQGFKKQLDSLKENKAFLFKQAEPEVPKDTGKISTAGNPNGTGQTTEKTITEKIAERLAQAEK